MTTAPLRILIVAAALVLGFVMISKAFPDAAVEAQPAADAPTAPTGDQPPATTAPPAEQSPQAPAEPRQVDGVVVQVLNGTEESGLAASAADELQQYGYEISGVGNAQRNYRVTTLFYQPDAQAAAEQLAADFFPEARLEAANNNLSPNIQVTVVIGEDAL